MNQTSFPRGSAQRKFISWLLTAVLVFTAAFGCMALTTGQAGAATRKTEVRGIWFSFCDFKTLGLYNKSEKTFTRNLDKALNRAKYQGCNTIYWHARAFDDATWKSRTFKASAYLTSKASTKKTASRVYSYDPLKIVVREGHERGLKVHAWLNPYRITYSRFLNPKSKRSTSRINRAVNELKAYSLDGIHFDDYFYHSTRYYRTPAKGQTYRISVRGSDTAGTPSARVRRACVNRMVRTTYKNVHKKKGWVFGISPQGNYENCMSGGCDVKTWLQSKKAKYVDYLVPQIYWTDNWGSSGRTKMFTTRLNLFKKLNKRNVDMYIGLALYRTGKKAGDDRGWGWRSTNLRTQVKKMRAAKLEGYVLFTSADLYRSGAQKELKNLRRYVK